MTWGLLIIGSEIKILWSFFEFGRGWIILNSIPSNSRELWKKLVWITANEYDKKIQKLKQEERDIYEQLKDHSRWDEAFLLSSSYILELANRAYTLFKGSQISKKRELINFIFANLEVDGSNLVYKIKEPFNELLFCGQSWKWLPNCSQIRTINIASKYSELSIKNPSLAKGISTNHHTL